MSDVHGRLDLFGPTWPIEPIEWARQTGVGPTSPFHAESRRPLRLTFHTESLVDLPGSEADAFDALLDLASMKEIEAIGTGPSHFPQMLIEDADEFGLRQIRTDYGDGRISYTGIRVDNLTADRRSEVLEVLAHKTLRHDLFVTANPWLLENRMRSPLCGMNVVPPSAAARITGLFLRSRGNYHAYSHFLFQGGYHFYLMRFVLRSLWRYVSACVKSRRRSEQTPSSLGGALLTRAERALQARDAIGIEFHGGGPGAIGRIEYHFDYLMLLLNGAFDALARIAFLTYGMTKPGTDSKRNFRDDQFRTCLEDAGGLRMVAVVERNIAFLKVVAHLRNTIHGSSLKGVLVNKMTPEAFCLEVPTLHIPQVGALVEATPDRDWGITDSHSGLMLSPYVFADAAVREAFRVINELADNTEVERLVDDQDPKAGLMDGPPQDGAFGERFGRRFVAIGW